MSDSEEEQVNYDHLNKLNEVLTVRKPNEFRQGPIFRVNNENTSAND